MEVQKKGRRKIENLLHITCTPGFEKLPTALESKILISKVLLHNSLQLNSYTHKKHLNFLSEIRLVPNEGKWGLPIRQRILSDSKNKKSRRENQAQRGIAARESFFFKDML